MGNLRRERFAILLKYELSETGGWRLVVDGGGWWMAVGGGWWWMRWLVDVDGGGWWWMWWMVDVDGGGWWWIVNKSDLRESLTLNWKFDGEY